MTLSMFAIDPVPSPQVTEVQIARALRLAAVGNLVAAQRSPNSVTAEQRNLEANANLYAANVAECAVAEAVIGLQTMLGLAAVAAGAATRGCRARPQDVGHTGRATAASALAGGKKGSRRRSRTKAERSAAKRRAAEARAADEAQVAPGDAGSAAGGMLPGQLERRSLFFSSLAPSFSLLVANLSCQL